MSGVPPPRTATDISAGMPAVASRPSRAIVRSGRLARSPIVNTAAKTASAA